MVYIFNILYMKKIITFLLFFIFLGISGVSADNTWSWNIAPVANFDVANTTKNVAVLIHVLANDTDANWDTLSITWTWNVLNGKATISWTGIIFTPNTWFFWIWSFNYTISDSHSWTALWYVNVNVSNTAPVANDDNVSTIKDTAITINVLSNDTDLDLDPLKVTWTNTVINGSTTYTSTWVRFTPNPWFLWIWSFNYTIEDINWATDTWYVKVEVKEKANTAPIANNDTVTTQQDKSKFINVLSNDTDADWDTLTVVWTTNVLNGTTTYTSTWVTFTPTTWFVWIWSFTYNISDWKWWTDSWFVQVKVIKNQNNGNYQDDDEDEDSDYNDNNNWNNKYKNKNKNKNKWKYKYEGSEYPWNSWSHRQDIYKNPNKKDMYKNIYRTKYSSRFSTLSDAKIQELLDKIDSLIITITLSTSYSDESKTNLLSMLQALREVIQES